MANGYYQNLQALAAQREANRQRELQAKAQQATLAAAAKAQLEQDKIDAREMADKMRQKAAFDLLTTKTNAAWNLDQSHKAADALKPTITLTEDKDGVKVQRRLRPDQYASEMLLKNQPKITALKAELDDHAAKILAGDKRFGFLNYASRPNRVTEINEELASLQPSAALGGADPVAAAAAMPVAPIQAHSPTNFNGTTSWTGPGFAPVESKGFIGTPGGENLFRAGPDPIEAAAASMPTEMAPARGDLQLAESTAPAPKVAPAAAATAKAEAGPKIVIQNGNRFQINPDGTTEHLGPVEAAR